MHKANKKSILIIIGSAGSNSANLQLIEFFADLTSDVFDVEIFNSLKDLPHFDPELTDKKIPEIILSLQNKIEEADGVIICTPEYIFSIPSGLKNAIEWCVSTTVFSGKPAGIITASASGEKAHQDLQLIMKTLMANFTPETTLLIQGIKGKVKDGKITDPATRNDLTSFIEAYTLLVTEKA